MNYKQINNLTGWAVFGIALLTYLLTMASTASFWDCGEFIACSNELEVPHPPGAPFFLLLGRIFAMFAFGDVTKVAFMVNLMSALASAFTVLFTFWIVTMLGRKILAVNEKASELKDTIAIMGAGVVGALAVAFSDSFWFNAVEAEVYALSSFFTAVVVWAMFKWDNHADEAGSQRWLILIAYLMGLSIGVHLLNLLTIPALAFIYYFRKYSFSWGGFIATGAIAVGILGVIQTGIILYTFDLAWAFEKFFIGTAPVSGKNPSGLGLPIGSGLVVFMVLLIGALSAAAWYSQKKGRLWLNTAVMGAIVTYVGLGSYAMIPIRSKANPPIDENNPENTLTFLSYMKREQYGDRPLMYGPLYNAIPRRYDRTPDYILEEGKKRYTEYGYRMKPVYNEADMKVFPRMYEPSRYNTGPHAYQNYVRQTGDPNSPYDDQPTNQEDMKFFWNYQVVHMYWRYFMWNFAGRESDVQDCGWESGLNFSKTASMPESVRKNPAKNHYYMIPFILGLLGLWWQARSRPTDAVVIGLLFFFTGFAIIIYLNQYPMQPRERDYSFAGSFQTFAIWIGLSVIALYDLLKRHSGVAYGATIIGLAAPLLMLRANWDDHSRKGNYLAPDSAYNLLNSLAPGAVLFTNGDNDTFPLWYLQEVENVRPDVRVLCLSYVNTDWYIDQMYMKMNGSEPLPLTLKKSEYTGQSNQAKYYPAAQKKLDSKLPVNAPELIAKGIISESEAKLLNSDVFSWSIPTRGGGGDQRYLELKDMVIKNLVENVAKGGWERPVYFANTVAPNSFIGLRNNLRLEGLAYRIMPVTYPDAQDPFDPYDGYVDPSRMYDALISKFQYRGMDNENVYYDENAARMATNYQSVFYRLANRLLREAEELENAQKGLEVNIPVETPGATPEQLREKAKEVMSFYDQKLPYKALEMEPYYVAQTGIMLDRLGMAEKAKEYFDHSYETATETLDYYQRTDQFFGRADTYVASLRLMAQHYSMNNNMQSAQEMMDKAERYARFFKVR